MRVRESLIDALDWVPEDALLEYACSGYGYATSPARRMQHSTSEPQV
jgi:hypothetical protein